MFSCDILDIITAYLSQFHDIDRTGCIGTFNENVIYTCEECTWQWRGWQSLDKQYTWPEIAWLTLWPIACVKHSDDVKHNADRFSQRNVNERAVRTRHGTRPPHTSLLSHIFLPQYTWLHEPARVKELRREKRSGQDMACLRVTFLCSKCTCSIRKSFKLKKTRINMLVVRRRSAQHTFKHIKLQALLTTATCVGKYQGF